MFCLGAEGYRGSPARLARKRRHPNNMTKLSLPILKMIFGFCLLIVVATLAAIIAVGHIEEKTSFGLQFLLGSLSTLSGSFSTWAFTAIAEREKEKDSVL